ncbi:hypothetical protein GCM10011352_18540 [Marinobacterium zhoushanense]|uniref:Uncharacterized protein n=1 Tax=Marinobacterium zhoushanense TaxID=1679163 RepID=A0ABQ1KE86_9GAMM|nr:hypothetical protein GCM10011352_18540 [Marinobacterium zhoushanense]
MADKRYHVQVLRLRSGAEAVVADVRAQGAVEAGPAKRAAIAARPAAAEGENWVDRVDDDSHLPQKCLEYAAFET